MSQPTVSVVIPAYNAQLTIVRALQSVANQTFQVTEVIVIDDASTDNTIGTVSEYSKNSTIAIQLLPSDRNVGPGSARNRGWDSSNSDYIAFLDADDVWHPKKLKFKCVKWRKIVRFQCRVTNESFLFLTAFQKLMTQLLSCVS